MSTSSLSVAGLSIERLKTFCLVAEEGSIVAAAPDDATRQSQFCRQIKELEGALGDRLFSRQGRKLVLTQAGRKLASATAGYFAALEEIHASAIGRSAFIRLGASECVLRWVILPRFDHVLAACPGVRFEFLTADSAQSLEGLEQGRLDLAVTTSSPQHSPLVSLAAGTMSFRWVVPRSLIPHGIGELERTAKELPLALVAYDAHFADDVLAVANRNHLNAVVRLFADSFGLVFEALENGNLAAVLPSPATAGLSAERFLIVDWPGSARLRRDLHLVYSARSAEIWPSSKSIAECVAAVLRMADFSHPSASGEKIC